MANSVNDVIEDLLQEREKTHGSAWLDTSHVMMVLDYLHRPIANSIYVYAWTIILNKIIRAMFQPDFKDHWVDIIGYATLVVKDIESIEAANAKDDPF